MFLEKMIKKKEGKWGVTNLEMGLVIIQQKWDECLHHLCGIIDVFTNIIQKELEYIVASHTNKEERFINSSLCAAI